jgi:hypothetical protein
VSDGGTTVPLLTPADIQARLAERQTGKLTEQNEQVCARYQYVRPFGMAADGLIEATLNDQGRFMFGLHEIDLMTRGIGRSELAYVIGRAHGGKTQVVLNAVRHDPSKRILWFTPDEVSELILSKLVAMTHGIDAESVEAQIKQRDQRMIDMVKRTAYSDYANLIVIDETLTMGQMSTALQEAEDYWGARADCVVVDFLELIPGDDNSGDGVIGKSQALKRWTKAHDVPVICCHQSAKSLAPRGQSSGMDGMRYGGDTEAIFVFEVYRKRDDAQLDEWDVRHHANTISVAVHKNKRPPCKKGEQDYWIEPSTGLIRPLTEADFATQGVPMHDASALAEARQRMAQDQMAMLGEADDGIPLEAF